MRRKLFLLPILLCLAVLFALVSGCARSIQTSAEQQFNQTVQAAVNAFRRGNPDAGNRFLNSAVAMTQNSRAGYAEVARRVSGAGRHAEAANFLRGALKKRNLSWDPVLWAMLADASRQAGDTARQQEAKAEAARRAGDHGRRGEGGKKSGLFSLAPSRWNPICRPVPITWISKRISGKLSKPIVKRCASIRKAPKP